MQPLAPSPFRPWDFPGVEYWSEPFPFLPQISDVNLSPCIVGKTLSRFELLCQPSLGSSSLGGGVGLGHVPRLTYKASPPHTDWVETEFREIREIVITFLVSYLRTRSPN